MSYNAVGTPTFYCDAVLLARQWGAITTSTSDRGKYYLNPTKVTPHTTSDTSGLLHIHIDFAQRYWCNSISHLFILGHNLLSDSMTVGVKIEKVDEDGSGGDTTPLLGAITPTINGWSMFPITKEDGVDRRRLTTTFSSGTVFDKDFSLGDISAGWSFKMPHSPDLQLTQTIDNESVKSQNTKSGHTLTSSSYNQQAGWIKPAWSKGTSSATSFNNDNFKVFPSGRRSWNLKFSYINQESLFPEEYNSSYGIFDGTAGVFSIKDNFHSKIMMGTNNFQLPFIFQPNSEVEEYAICRVVNKPSFNQVANNVYDTSLDLVEVF